MPVEEHGQNATFGGTNSGYQSPGGMIKAHSSKLSSTEQVRGINLVNGGVKRFRDSGACQRTVSVW